MYWVVCIHTCVSLHHSRIYIRTVHTCRYSTVLYIAMSYLCPFYNMHHGSHMINCLPLQYVSSCNVMWSVLLSTHIISPLSEVPAHMYTCILGLTGHCLQLALYLICCGPCRRWRRQSERQRRELKQRRRRKRTRLLGLTDGGTLIWAHTSSESLRCAVLVRCLWQSRTSDMCWWHVTVTCDGDMMCRDLISVVNSLSGIHG